jgi:hypothetical protein
LNDAPSSFHQMMNEEHEEREDSYGCGIDECYPCSSSLGLETSKLNGVTVIPSQHFTPYHPLTYCYSLSFFYSSSVFLHSSPSVEYEEELCGHHSTPCSSMEEGKQHFDSTIQKKFLFLSSFFSFFFLFK